MKNKEIKELLKYLKDEKEYYYEEEEVILDGGEIVLEEEDVDLLLSYIEQLEKKVDQYENPDDLTLFYMWLDTKAKDKMKQLENNRDKAIELIEKELKYPPKYLTGYSAIQVLNILKGDSDE